LGLERKENNKRGSELMEALMEKSLKCFASVLAISLIFGCSTNAPLKTLYYNSEENISQKNMIIFLRGRGGSHEGFASEGFINDIKTRKLSFDMAAPNAHFGYYFGETLVPRLKADIIDSARAEGYERFWLVGVSMGGLGALMYTRQYPEDVEGVCVISPFLGYHYFIQEIAEAGGVRSWDPGDYDPDDDWQRMFWHWLKQCANGEIPMPRLFLGYGTEDPFVRTHGLLRDLLPPDHVFTTSGGHSRETMKRLWRIFLEKDVMK
jgi:pimeloyl-ACP methyl ester carboxylesterase